MMAQNQRILTTIVVMGETSESGWCSDDSESEMQPEKRLKWSSNQDNEDSSGE